MTEITLVFPISTGMIGPLEQFAARLSGPDSELFRRSQQRLGISRESWFLHHLSSGELVVVYAEAEDVLRSLGLLRASQDPEDRMLKREVGRLTGVDFERGPAPAMPRQLLAFRT